LPDCQRLARWGDGEDSERLGAETQIRNMESYKLILLWIDLIFIKKGSEVPNYLGKMGLRPIWIL
jgi:hypothetical protein